jgi:hypothetical protein
MFHTGKAFCYKTIFRSIFYADYEYANNKCKKLAKKCKNMTQYQQNFQKMQNTYRKLKFRRLDGRVVDRLTFVLKVAGSIPPCVKLFLLTKSQTQNSQIHLKFAFFDSGFGFRNLNSESGS